MSTPAQRAARSKWQRTHPEQHAARQRAWRALVKAKRQAQLTNHTTTKGK